MKIEEHIKYWVESADHDLESAESLFEVRYPEYRHEFYKKCTQDFAEPYFMRIKEMFQWIKSHIE